MLLAKLILELVLIPGIRLHAADAELAAAKRSADRPAEELVTVPVVSIYASRVWAGRGWYQAGAK